MTLGAYLRARRLASGKTVAAIVEHMGISRPGLYWWEGPKTRPDPADIRRLLEFYGCSEEQIVEAQRLREQLPPPVRNRPSGNTASETSEDSETNTSPLVEERTPASAGGAA